MKILIKANNNTFTAVGNDDFIMAKFREFVSALIDAGHEDIAIEEKPAINPVTVATMPTPLMNGGIVPREHRDESGGYTGFLYIECEQCRNTRGMNVKKPLTHYRCDCGHMTPLLQLVPLNLRCECGKSWGYRTNLHQHKDNKIIEAPCLNCESPMTAEYIEKRNCFEPLR